MKKLPIGSQYCTDKTGAMFCESISKTTRTEVVNKIEIVLGVAFHVMDLLTLLVIT